ncbi:hypothetical protein UM610_10080 [Staphylococcus aureus]|nr:hypothetical protein UM610_10080 [Staphylococcus aureus]
MLKWLQFTKQKGCIFLCNFLSQKIRTLSLSDWEISEQVRVIVKQYAEYAERTESEAVDEFLLNILDDKKFIEWIANKRSNKRIVEKMGIKDRVG